MRDFFQLLGLERRYHLDGKDLEARYHALAREHHPDKHVRDASAARVKSALATADLTEAYRTLKDPVRRAEHLLALEGWKIGDERESYKGSPAFLVEIMELRESLEEAEAAKDESRIRALAGDVRGRQTETRSTIDELFRRYDAGERGPDGVIRAVADALVAERYYRRFLDEIEAHEERQLEASLDGEGEQP